MFFRGDSWCPIGLFLKTLGADLSFDVGTTVPLSLTSLRGETELHHHLISVLVSHWGHAGTFVPSVFRQRTCRDICSLSFQTEASKQLSMASNKWALTRQKVPRHTSSSVTSSPGSSSAPYQPWLPPSNITSHPDTVWEFPGQRREIKGEGEQDATREPTGPDSCHFSPPNSWQERDIALPIWWQLSIIVPLHWHWLPHHQLWPSYF